MKVRDLKAKLDECDDDLDVVVAINGALARATMAQSVEPDDGRPGWVLIR